MRYMLRRVRRGPLGVVGPPRRAAACGHRAFSACFLAMNPIARLSQIDPNPPARLLQSCLTLGPTSSGLRVYEAAIQDLTHPVGSEQPYRDPMAPANGPKAGVP